MRKTVLTLTSIAIISSSYAQNWLDLGIKGGYGLSLLYNQNIFDDSGFNHQLSGAYSFGGKMGLNLGENHEVTVDVISSSFKQKFKFNITDSLTGSSPSFNSQISYQALDILLMYRSNDEGRYFEIGPYMSLLKDARHTNEYLDITNETVTNNWSKNGYGVALGFGAYLIGSENFGVTFGARINYMISDAISALGQSNNFPANKNYEVYKASHPFSAMIVMEMNYDLGYLASAKCSKRRKIILF